MRRTDLKRDAAVSGAPLLSRNMFTRSISWQGGGIWGTVKGGALGTTNNKVDDNSSFYCQNETFHQFCPLSRRAYSSVDSKYSILYFK